MGGLGNVGEMVNGKGIGGRGRDIEVLDREVNRVGRGVDRWGKRVGGG